jgi:hypothetical protein
VPGEAGQPVTLGVGVGVYRTEREPGRVGSPQRVGGSVRCTVLVLVAEPELSGNAGCA